MTSSIYQKDFLKRSQNLKYAGTNSGKKLIANNPLCGDRQTIYVEVGDGKFSAINFQPEGCMVSQVATDILIDYLLGKSVDDVNDLSVKDVEELIGSELSPSRKKCGELGLRAIKNL